MKNYRTTLLGSIFAALTFLQTYQANGGNINDWKLWLIPAVIAALGYAAKDAGVTGAAKILIGCLALLLIPSCTTLKKVGASLSTPQAVQVEASLADLAIAEAKAAGKISAGDAVAITNGMAIITTPGNAVSKIIPLTDLISDTAVTKGLLTPGTGLLIKDTTAIVVKTASAAPVSTPVSAPPANTTIQVSTTN